jgi:hypothetical protein
MRSKLENQRVIFLKKIFTLLWRIKAEGISVILVNNAVADMSKTKGKVKPAMGDFFGQMVDERLKISKLAGFDLMKFRGDNSVRKVVVEYSGRLKIGEFMFLRIFDGGVEFVEKS